MPAFASLKERARPTREGASNALALTPRTLLEAAIYENRAEQMPFDDEKTLGIIGYRPQK